MLFLFNVVGSFQALIEYSDALSAQAAKMVRYYSCQFFSYVADMNAL